MEFGDATARWLSAIRLATALPASYPADSPGPATDGQPLFGTLGPSSE